MVSESRGVLDTGFGTKLGSPVVPFCPFYLGVSFLEPNIRKKGTLIIKGLLGNLEKNSAVLWGLRPWDSWCFWVTEHITLNSLNPYNP